MTERTGRHRVQPQIRRLIETATALRAGTATYFPITRLTNVKSLCKEPEIAARFVLHLAERTLERMQAQARPTYTDPADWARYQALVGEAVALIGDYLHAPSEQGQGQLRSILRSVAAVQAYSGEQIWGRPLRTIHSAEVLIIEDALRCITQPWAAPYWAYQTAKDYAERYDPRYGTGLIPESLPLLDDIIAFWIGRDPER
jgi:hypothetical protein